MRRRTRLSEQFAAGRIPGQIVPALILLVDLYSPAVSIPDVDVLAADFRPNILQLSFSVDRFLARRDECVSGCTGLPRRAKGFKYHEEHLNTAPTEWHLQSV